MDHDLDVPLVDDALLQTLLTVDTVTVVRGGPPPARLRLLAAFSVLLALVGGVVVVARHAPAADPDAVLAKAQAAVADASSFRFEMRTTTHVTTGDPDGAGSDTTYRSVSTGAVAGKDRWRVVEEDSYGDVTPYETRRIGDRIYFQGGDDPSDVGVGPAWDAGDVGDEQPTAEDYAAQYLAFEEEGFSPEEDPEFLLDSLLAAYLLPVGDDAAHIERLVTESSQPAVEERLADGGLRLRTQLDPIPAFVDASDDPIPPVDLTLDLDSAGLPMAVHFSVAVEGASESVGVAFRDWGQEIAVTAPDEVDVDQTPWIEEEKLAALEPGFLVAPTTLPGDFELVYAYVYSYADEEIPGTSGPCHNVDLSYGSKESMRAMADMDPAAFDDEEAQAAFESMPFLDVSLSSPSCDFDDTPFDQPLGGRSVRNLQDGYVEVMVGDTLVTVSSDLSEADLGALVRSLRPATTDQIASQVPDWAREDAGAWFSGFTVPAGIG